MKHCLLRIIVTTLTLERLVLGVMDVSRELTQLAVGIETALKDTRVGL
jgi:hypothetical protein